MFADDILVKPLFTQGYLFIYPKHCDLSGQIKMEICIIEKYKKLIDTKL